MRSPARTQEPGRRLAVALVVVLVPLLVAPALSGCLSIERTGWAYSVTQIDELESKGLTGKGVIVGIIDTGIDPDHPSLDHIDIVAWRDYVGNQEKPYDDSGHGTHIAGIIAARGGGGDWFSGADLEGVAPAVKLIVVKACGAEECSVAGVKDGIAWAAAQGADIITLSLGGRQTFLNLGDESIQAVQNAAKQGVYVVAAAGNAGDDHGDVESPSSARLAIAVGAVDKRLQVADFSSRGSQSSNQGTSTPLGGVGGREDPHKKPELVAPGVDILSAWKGGQYAEASGTSQAAPFVAGTLALLLEAHPEWKRSGSRNDGESSVTTMKSVLTKSAKTLEGQRTPHDNAAGYGLLQAERALERLKAA
ncbi:MAG: S8 family serine peptidase [Euryarchaeota archaeon]|nr:S8 family serine peptidase [Euryarchaeota archaeon]